MSVSRWRRRETWLVALAVAPVEGGAYAVAALTGWLLVDWTPRFLTLGPFLLGFAAVLTASAPMRRRLLTPSESWLRDQQAQEGSGEGLLDRLRRGPEGWWHHEAAVGGVWLFSWLALVAASLGGLTLARVLDAPVAASTLSHPTVPILALSLTALPLSVVAAAAGRTVPDATRLTAVVAARTDLQTLGSHTLLGALRGFLAGGIVVVLWLGIDTLGPLPVVAAVVVPTLCRVATFNRVGDSTTALTPTRDRRREAVVVLLALLLVSAPVVATAAVRIDDAGYPNTERRSLSDGPSAALSAATANTLGGSYRGTRAVRTFRDGEWSTTRWVRGVDRRDRQYRVVTRSDDATLRGFDGEGVSAAAGDGALVSDDGPLRWRRGDWGADAGTTGAFVAEGAHVETLSAVAPWQVVRENGSSLVLGVDGAAVLEAAGVVPNPDDGAVIGNATARVVVDRERAVLETTRIDVTYYRVENGNRTGRRERHVRRHYENVGSHDVGRPEALGPRHPAEWVWDLLYY